MKRLPWSFWVGSISIALVMMLGLWFAVPNLWAYLRLRAVPVEVLQSSLKVDAARGETHLRNFLLLDLRTTDGAERRIRAEELLSRATYPEEALDELRAWAPGSRHVVYELRGATREIRLPGAGQSPELDTALLALGLTLFVVVMIFIITMAVVQERLWMQSWPVFRYLGFWTPFSAVGLFMGLALMAFLWFEAPRRWSWQPVEATADGPAELGAEAPRRQLPEEVQVTPAAAAVLERAAYRILQFAGPEGSMLHAGIGNLNGPYEGLAANCPVEAASCRFFVDPNDRWDFEVDPSWDERFFLPAGMLFLFAVVFSAVGWFLRREK